VRRYFRRAENDGGPAVIASYVATLDRTQAKLDFSVVPTCKGLSSLKAAGNEA